MNKKSFLLLASAMLLGACGDADIDAETTKNSEPATEEVSSETESSEIAESSQSVVESVEPKEDKPSGKRSDPLPFTHNAKIYGETYATDGSEFEFEMEIQFSNPIRGEEAWTFIQGQNMYNEPAPEGYEWLVFDITAKLTKGSIDDAYTPMIDFSSVSTDGTPSPDGHYVAFENYGDELDSPELYEGGTATGKKAVLIPVNDPSATIKVNYDWSLDAFYSLPE